MNEKECPVGGCDSKAFEEKYEVKLITAKLRLDQSLQCPNQKCKIWNPLRSEFCCECGERILSHELTFGDAARLRKREVD